MLYAYICYPTQTVNVHLNPACPHIRRTQTPDPRVRSINPENLSAELHRFANTLDRFASESGLNDMWLQIDFDDAPFEQAVLRYILNLIGNHYTWLARVLIGEPHCQAGAPSP